MAHHGSSPVQVQGLQRSVLRHVVHDLREPQDGSPGHPGGDRHLRERRQGPQRPAALDCQYKVVIVARERDGETLTQVHKSEADGEAFVAATVAHGSTIHADEASHWDALEARYLTKRIDHSVAYSDETDTNMAESFFSRIRRAEIGIHHHIAGPYPAAYAMEMAWREDNRRVSNGEQFLAATGAALTHPVSRSWKGYWRRCCLVAQAFTLCGRYSFFVIAVQHSTFRLNSQKLLGDIVGGLPEHGLFRQETKEAHQFGRHLKAELVAGHGGSRPISSDIDEI